MTDYIFSPPAIVSLPIAGSTKRFPVRRIFCIGRNYAAHAVEMGFSPERGAPFYFNKSLDAVVESGATVPYPPGTQNYHYEIELVVAIGAPAFQVAAKDASVAIFGYACGLDMTRRDLQLAARDKGRPWDLAKDFEGAAVLSAVTPVGEAGNIEQSAIELKVNGEVKQASNISMLLFNISEIIENLSKFYRLQPGDLIFTGTPEGVGPVLPGDRLEGRIDGVGAISLTIGNPRS